MKDYIVRAMDKKGRIKMSVAMTTNSVEKARVTHDSSATSTAAIGRSMTAAMLMGNMMKNEKDIMTLRINGGGPIGNIIMVSDNQGNVKGYADNPAADVPSINNSLDVKGVVGTQGHVTVTMDIGLREPYVGQSDIISGEIAEDITYYYATSEQQPAAVSLGVLVEKDLSVKAAGGFIIQLLPGIKDEDIDYIEEALNKIEPISTLIDQGLTPEEIVEKVLCEFDMKILEKTEVDYVCDCSRERVSKVLSNLNVEELRNIIEEDKGAELVCHFCNKKYYFEEEDLKEIILDKENK